MPREKSPAREQVFPAQLVLLAMGFVGPEKPAARPARRGEGRPRQRQADDGKFATSVAGVFAAGDMRRGQCLVVWAINEGRGAARGVRSLSDGRDGTAVARGTAAARRRTAVSGGAWWVYLAQCGDGTLYCGIARDVQARISAHGSGKGARYTRGRGPIVLLSAHRCRDQGTALRIERAIKGLSRSESWKPPPTPDAGQQSPGQARERGRQGR